MMHLVDFMKRFNVLNTAAEALPLIYVTHTSQESVKIISFSLNLWQSQALS